MKDLVSVIIPVYNAEKTIEKTIQSVIDQTYSNIQIIIIDDKSIDNSLELIKKVSRKDTRIKVYMNDRNLGVAATRNRAIELSMGNFICFVDSDDIWKSGKIEKQINYIKKNDGDICYTSYEMIDRSSKKVKCIVSDKVSYYDILKENIICCSTVMIKRNILIDNKFSKEFFHEDLVLWLQLLKQGYKALGIDEVLVTYRKGGRSSNKLKASINRWMIYRRCEKINIFKSIYFFVTYSLNGIKKYYFK